MAEEISNKESQSAYRSIFKATSLFGGVQVYTILVQIIKSKVIAVLLGPLGVGIQGLYQSALDLIKQATSFGLAQSAVRDVAEAQGSGDSQRISNTITSLKVLVWFTGLLGTICIIIFSPLLSKSSFGNLDHILPFFFLSIILLLDQLSAGQRVILQGTRRLSDLAKSTALGVTISLLFSVPLYFTLGLKAIVPTMIITAAVSLLVSWYYSRRISIEKVKLPLKKVFYEGKSMMALGLSMSASGVLAMGAAYLIRSLIREWGSTEEVGLFQAGFVIINTYVGLVFNAISTDYYPRLASVNKDNIKCKEVVSQQGEVSVFLLAPLLSICILAMPLVITILYSNEFLPADGFIKWACLGMMFRLSSWLVAYIFIAKAESRLYVINEVIGNINYLWMSLVGFRVCGMVGLGIAFTVSNFVYFWQVYFIARIKYSFSFSKQFLRSFFIQLFLVSSCLICVIALHGSFCYIFGTVFVILSIVGGIIGLNKRVGLNQVLKKILHK